MSLFEICSFSSSDPFFFDLISIGIKLHQKYDFQLLNYSKARMMITDDIQELGFIIEFLSHIDLIRAIEATFDVIDDLMSLIRQAQRCESLFEPGFDQFPEYERFSDLIEAFEQTTPAELILKVRRQIHSIIDAIQVEFIPIISELNQETLSQILTFSSRIHHSMFSSNLEHIHTFQIRLLQLLSILIERLEPYESGYVAQSLRIELMEKLNDFITEIIESMQNDEVTKNETLVKLLMPFDSAVEFNLKLRNVEIERLALDNRKSDTIIEQIVDLALSIGIWSHPDFFLNRSGKLALEKFNMIYLELLKLDQLRQFLLDDILLTKLIFCEIRLPDPLKEYLRSIAPEKLVDFRGVLSFIQQLLD